VKKVLKVIIIFIILVFLTIGGAILFRSRGEWVCEDGEWVKAGRPRGALPPKKNCFKIENEGVGSQPVETRDVTGGGTPLEGFKVWEGDWQLAPAGFDK
jgi:hypothetical protein